MRLFTLSMLGMSMCMSAYGQTKVAEQQNIYKIKEQFLHQVMHNPAETAEDEADNELARFNRWFNMAEARSYPSGNLPRPDVLLRSLTQHNAKARTARKTSTGLTPWQPVGPVNVPTGYNGIGRINCVVISPTDTNTLYVGTACGGVFISHDRGTTWSSTTDKFPSLSIADIAVHPTDPDTIYVATGDGFGYENGTGIFWGGLYSAGVMRSTDGGATWDTTGLTYLQSDRDMIQKLLLHPTKPNILLAATRNGLLRSTDRGATWATVDGGHIYSMAFRPEAPDTVYAIKNKDLRISYDAGATWTTRFANISTVVDRSTIAVSPAAPYSIWVLNGNNNLLYSKDAGATFSTKTSPDAAANFYGYYDRVLAVSPTDTNFVVACGLDMAKSANNGSTWNDFNPSGGVHADHHAIAINPLRPQTIYNGNDGGISVTNNGGASWKNISNGLMISQIYKFGNSNQNPSILICGLQDNGTFHYNGTTWKHKTGGDGMACAIHPLNDDIQVSSYQYGNFYISYNKGTGFSPLSISSSEDGAWVSPVVFDPNDENTIYFGLKNIYVTRNQGTTIERLTPSPLFAGGAISMAMSGSSSNVIYAANYSTIYRSTNKGATWTNVTGTPAFAGAITNIAVDPADSMKVYVTLSGYNTGKKVYRSTSGGTTWTNISADLPNIPVNCLAVDSSTPGALFAGTDMGVYYTDASMTGWVPYSAGFPNVIVNDLAINYTDYKLRAATFGRGVWVTTLPKEKPVVNSASNVVAAAPKVTAYPNPTTGTWKLQFAQKPASFEAHVIDFAGRTVLTAHNTEVIDASRLAAGFYAIEVNDGVNTYTVKAVKE